MPTNAQAQTPAVPSASPSSEGELLIAAVSANVGYALTATQAAEVRKQLATYPGAFGKVRAFQLPDDIGPAFAPLAPPAPARRPRKGSAR